MSKKIKYEEYGNYGKFIGGRMSGKSFLDDDELTPLEVAKQLKDFIFELDLGNVDKLFIKGSFDIIETALIENDEVQRELTNLKKALLRGDITNKWANDYANQKNKKLKALKIIKKYIKVYKIHNGYMLTDENAGETMISKEEYDLLKEVLM